MSDQAGQGRGREAIPYARRAVMISGGNAATHRLLGRLLSLHGEHGEAIQHLEAAPTTGLDQRLRLYLAEKPYRQAISAP